MAKFRTDPINSTDIAEYLKSQNDFALELSVYATARSLGFSVSHSGTYEDPVSGKHRQYDVRVHAMNKNRQLRLAIECKALQPSYPLVVLRTPRSPAESRHEFIYSYQPSPDSVVFGKDFCPAKPVTVRGSAAVYRHGEQVGRATVQLGRNSDGAFVAGDADVYDKWAQALASASELVTDSIYAHTKSPRQATVTAVIPILVVADETLWVVDYADDGAEIGAPQQADEVFLYVAREYPGPGAFAYSATHLHIYTKQRVQAYLREVAADASLWDAVFPLQDVPQHARDG